MLLNIHNGSQMTLKVKWKLLNTNVFYENPEIQKSKMKNPKNSEIQESRNRFASLFSGAVNCLFTYVHERS